MASNVVVAEINDSFVTRLIYVHNQYEIPNFNFQKATRSLFKLRFDKRITIAVFFRGFR